VSVAVNVVHVCFCPLFSNDTWKDIVPKMCVPMAVSRFKKSEAIKHEFLELSSEDTAFVEELWSLYSQTGEKNGFTVLTKEEFFKFHASVPDLVVSIAWVGVFTDCVFARN